VLTSSRGNSSSDNKQVFCDIERQKGRGYRSASYDNGEAGIT
jgi:hypothetical protein